MHSEHKKVDAINMAAMIEMDVRRFAFMFCFASRFTIRLVSFSNGNVIAIHSFRCHPNSQMLQKYPKGPSI